MRAVKKAVREAQAAKALDALRQLTLPSGETWGEAMKRDPWIERDVLAPILERSPDGTPRYRVVWIELARGHAKTSIAAGVAMVAAFTTHGASVFGIASDQDQARLLLEALDGQRRRNPKLAARMQSGRDRYVVNATGSTITVLASDVPSGFGLAPDATRLLFILDELTQWPKRDMYDLAQTTLPKIRDAQLVVITNAGVRGSWQEEARDQIKAMAADGRAYLFAGDGVVASWLRPEDVALAEASVPPAVFRRYYQNEWTDSAGGFVTREMLERCVDPEWRPQITGDEEQAYAVGLDLGLTKDRTARAVVHYDALEQSVVLDDLRVWQGSRENPVLIADVEEDLERINDAFHQPVVACDPWQLQATLQKFHDRLRVEEFTFTSANVQRLSENLFRLLRNGQLRLYPDAELEAELLGLEVKQTSYGWRIDHQARGFSDRAMAVGMAALKAVSERPKRSIRAY